MGLPAFYDRRTPIIASIPPPADFAVGLRDFSSPDTAVLLVAGDEFAEKKPDNSED